MALLLPLLGVKKANAPRGKHVIYGDNETAVGWGESCTFCFALVLDTFMHMRKFAQACIFYR